MLTIVKKINFYVVKHVPINDEAPRNIYWIVRIEENESCLVCSDPKIANFIFESKKN